MRPERILALAVAALPERRREWGTAMLAELGEVHGRGARWRFALSGVRATLLLPPAGGWPALTVVVGVVVGAVAAVVPAVGAVAPGLTVFAVTLTALVGAMGVLAVARSYRPRLPVPLPTVLIVLGVVASVASTVHFVHREPAAARYLPAPVAVYLAMVLAACLWIALTATRGAAPYLGCVAGVVLMGWSLLSYRLEDIRPAPLLVVVLTVVLVVTPFAVFAVPAFAAARAGRSRRAGMRATVWTVAAAVPLTYALFLPEALRRHAIDGHTLDGELVAPAAVNLETALFLCLGLLPVFGFALGIAGAATGVRRSGGFGRAGAGMRPS